MAVVYRGPHVVVSDDFVDVLESGRRQRYAVGQLRAVNIFLEARGRDACAWRWASVLALPAAVAALVVDYRLALALLVIAIAAAVAYAYLKHGRPGRWHLMAVYRGEHRTLFSSTDRREFSQVCRGLRRALERHDDEMAA